jgi:hypothetical protein
LTGIQQATTRNCSFSELCSDISLKISFFNKEMINKIFLNLTTTSAVVKTTSAVVKTTSAVVKTTSAVVKTTSAVVKTTSAVVRTTCAVVKTTSAVVRTTSAVVKTASAVVTTACHERSIALKKKSDRDRARVGLCPPYKLKIPSLLLSSFYPT